jgi:hypothetical protein
MNNLYMLPHSAAGPRGGGIGLLPSPAAAAATIYFPIPAVSYHSAPGALTVGKFPNPRNVSRVLAGNNKEAQQFLSRGGQVIIRMRGLPYDCTAKQVVSTGLSISGAAALK